MSRKRSNDIESLLDQSLEEYQQLRASEGEGKRAKEPRQQRVRTFDSERKRFRSQSDFGAPQRSEVDLLLRQHPFIKNNLDPNCYRMLLEADTFRASEVIEEVAARGGIRNVSAFIAKALIDYPQVRDSNGPWAHAEEAFVASQMAFEKFLANHPAVHDALDEDALATLKSSDPFRAMEVVEEVSTLADTLNNLSAYVVKAIRSHPQVRDRTGEWALVQQALIDAQLTPTPKSEFDTLLARYPRIEASLDVAAMRLLRSTDAFRVMELLEELNTKGQHITNISAFVVKALKAHPQVRNKDGAWGEAQEVFSAAEQLDEDALLLLEAADASTAMKVLDQLNAKSAQIQNPSAFVVQALSGQRGRRSRR